MSGHRRVARGSLPVALVVFVLGAGALPALGQDADGEEGPAQATTLLDLSGLAWVEGDTFLAVHDAKTPDEDDRPRASLLTLTHDARGLTWEPLDLEWPEGVALPSDLESIAAIPDGGGFLLVESGDDGGPYQRMFHLAPDAEGELAIADVIDWPAEPTNVEGSAVARVGDQLLFLYAERAQGEPTTQIRWAPLTLEPIVFGDFSEAPFTSPAVRGPDDRPVSALEVGPDGRIYAASAFDSGDDDGPFSSSVWRIGRVTPDDGGSIVLGAKPRRLATLDGFKVESLAAVRGEEDETQLFAGTDDENHGGVLRPLP
jgi:hypothetical protein